MYIKIQFSITGNSIDNIVTNEILIDKDTTSGNKSLTSSSTEYSNINFR